MKINDKNSRAEILRYLFFGVCTTAVGWVVYFTVLWGAKAMFSIPTDDTSSAKYLAVYSAAQIIQWTAAVIFAFYTNKKWVFTAADQKMSGIKQLAVFASGRVITFGLDYAVTYLGALTLSAIIPLANSVEILGKEWNLNEIGAKLAAAVLVIIGNYVFSKVFVFASARKEKFNET